MKEKKRLKVLLVALCVILLLIVTVIAVIVGNPASDPALDSVQTESNHGDNAKNPTQNNGETMQGAEADPENNSTQNSEESSQETQKPTQNQQDPTETAGGESQATQTTTPSDQQITPPEDLPPSVTIPAETDPSTGEELGISFPCQVPGYGLVIEKMAPYSGMYVEDGSNLNVENVAMLLVKNDGDFPVEYTQIRVMCGQEELLFDISALPVGEKLVVQEKNGKTISSEEVTSATALVVQRANMEMSEGKVKVTDNGDNTLTIQNLTDETIPTIRVFYKYYMEEEDLFVGGIAFTVRVSRLGAGSKVTIQPSHYTSQTSRLVMVLTYDSEV